jgi:hypothetical protein
MSAGESALEWTAWPLRRRPGRGVLGAAIAAGAVALVAAASSSVPFTIAGSMVLAFALAPFFVPTRHRLDPRGVTVTRLGLSTRRPWTAFQSIHASDTICLLSPFERRSWLDAYRGSTLLLDGNRGEVVAYAEAMVGAARLARDSREGG